MNLKRAILPVGSILALLGGIAVGQVIPQPGPPTPIGCAYNTTPPTLTDGQAGWVQCDSTGRFIIDAAAGTQDVNVAKINGITPLMGNGVTGTGSLRVTIASDNSAVPVAHNATPSIANGNGVIIAPSSAATAGITPVVCGSAASSCVLKASAGNLYSIYAECSAVCWLMVFNSVSAPSNGATTAGIASGNMVECIPIIAGGAGSISSNGMPPSVYTVGITATISSTTCATLTLATTGFINGKVQ